MQRYFGQKIQENKIYFDITTSHHIKNVMRMSLGEVIEVVDDNKVYLAKINQLEPSVVDIIQEVEEKENLELPKVTLGQSLLKEQKMDFIFQKATELGVHSFIPIEATRSIIKLENKKEKKLQRWQTIVKEASEQSKRIDVPKVYPAIKPNELSSSEYNVKLLCTVNEMSITLKKVLSQCKKSDKMLIVIGPEGGFTSSEEKMLLEQGFIPVSLGELVFRSETVALYIMSVIQYQFMR